MANQTANKVRFGNVDIEFYGSVPLIFSRQQSATGPDVCEFTLMGSPVDAAILNISTTNTKIIIDVGKGKLITLGPRDRLEWDTAGVWLSIKQGFRYPSAATAVASVTSPVVTTQVVPPVVSSKVVRKWGDVEVEINGPIAVTARSQNIPRSVVFDIAHGCKDCSLTNVSKNPRAEFWWSPTGHTVCVRPGQQLIWDSTGNWSRTTITTASTANVVPPPTPSLSVHKETHGNVEVEFVGPVTVFFTNPQTSPDKVEFTGVMADPGNQIRNTSSGKNIIIFTQISRLSTLTLNAGDVIECDANYVFNFVKATTIAAPSLLHKYTLLLKNKDGSIEIAKLKPSASSTTRENPRSGVRVEFTEYEGALACAGMAERVDVYRDAGLYASVPIVPTYCSYGMDVSNFQIVVLDAHLVNKTTSLDDIKPATKSNGCTCGTWSTGGLCADYCDLVRTT